MTQEQPAVQFDLHTGDRVRVTYEVEATSTGWRLLPPLGSENVTVELVRRGSAQCTGEKYVCHHKGGS